MRLGPRPGLGAAPPGCCSRGRSTATGSSDPDHASEIEVRFHADGPAQTTVEVEHRYFERLIGGEGAHGAIRSGGGWPALLESYARMVKDLTVKDDQDGAGQEEQGGRVGEHPDAPYPVRTFGPDPVRPVPPIIAVEAKCEGGVVLMRYRITEHDADIEIHVHETGEHSRQLFASLQACQEGRCGCPTDQYDRLEDMAVQTDLDEVTIRLHPRAGQRFAPEQLQVCLDYTLAQVDDNAD